jgi:hypothetical protein
VQPAQAPWTVEDVVLLDEAAEQLGSWTSASQRQSARRQLARRRQQVEYARSVLEGLHLDAGIDPERFAERFAPADDASVGDKAARERTWR